MKRAGRWRGTPNEDAARSGFDRRDWAALFAIAAVWAGIVLSCKGPLSLTIVDDAYIYLRVVENWLSGESWSFNPGDPVNPLTSPLYALFLAPIRLAVRSGPAALLAAYASGLAALAAVVYAALRGRGRPFAGVAALIASSGYIAAHSVGMETSIFLALVALVAFAYERRRHFAAGLFAGLAALARPEGAALALVIAVLHLVSHRRVLWPLIAGFALTALPGIVFSWAAFGEIVPHTVRVKAAQTDIGYWGRQASWISAFIAQSSTPFLTYALALIGGAWAWREFRAGRPWALAVIGFGAAQVAAYSALRAPVGYFWYFAPGNLAVDVAVVAGLFVLGRWLRAGWETRRLRRESRAEGPREWMPPGGARARIRPLAGAARAAVFALLALVAASQLGAEKWKRIEARRFANDYVDVSRWIVKNTPRDARVAATEIGYLGYFTKRRIRDIHGLIHPEAFARVARAEWDWWFTEDPPEIVVVHVPPLDGEPSREWWPEESMRKFERRYSEAYARGALKVYVADFLDAEGGRFEGLAIRR